MRPLLIATLLFAASPLLAWTPGAVERMARKSTDLAPPDMRNLIDRYSAEFHQGLAYSTTEESRHVFLVEARRGALRGEIHEQVRGAIDALKKRESMGNVVERLGRIAHLVADANNPFATSNKFPRLAESRNDFEQYVERKQTSFPVVFYGLQNPFKLEPYIDAALIRSSSFAPLLDEEYFRFGGRRTSQEFDDRSTGFGVASLSYSHAVSDIINVYYYIWKEAGGDVRSARALEHSNLLLNQ